MRLNQVTIRSAFHIGQCLGQCSAYRREKDQTVVGLHTAASTQSIKKISIVGFVDQPLVRTYQQLHDKGVQEKYLAKEFEHRH